MPGPYLDRDTGEIYNVGDLTKGPLILASEDIHPVPRTWLLRVADGLECLCCF